MFTPAVDDLLRRKLTHEEYLVVLAATETLINQHRTPQDSTHFIRMIQGLRDAGAKDVDETCARLSRVREAARG